MTQQSLKKDALLLILASNCLLQPLTVYAQSTGQATTNAPQMVRKNQTPKPILPQSKPPLISDAQRATFFKLQSAYLAAQDQLKQTPQFILLQSAKNAMDANLRELLKACGTGFDVRINSQNEPECIPQNEPHRPQDLPPAPKPLIPGEK